MKSLGTNGQAWSQAWSRPLALAVAIMFAAAFSANAQPKPSVGAGVSVGPVARTATNSPRESGESRAATARPGIPHTVSYQGVLRGAKGAPASDGEYSITSRLYSDAEGKSLVWQGTYTAQVVNGVFNLMLGSGEYPLPPLPAMDIPLWVSIQVGDSPEMREFAPQPAPTLGTTLGTTLGLGFVVLAECG